MQRQPTLHDPWASGISRSSSRSLIMDKHQVDIATTAYLAATAWPGLKSKIASADQCTVCTWTKYPTPEGSYSKGCRACLEEWFKIARVSRQATAEDTAEEAAEEAEKTAEEMNKARLLAAIAQRGALHAKHEAIRREYRANLRGGEQQEMQEECSCRSSSSRNCRLWWEQCQLEEQETQIMVREEQQGEDSPRRTRRRMSAKELDAQLQEEEMEDDIRVAEIAQEAADERAVFEGRRAQRQAQVRELEVSTGIVYRMVAALSAEIEQLEVAADKVASSAILHSMKY